MLAEPGEEADTLASHSSGMMPKEPSSKPDGLFALLDRAQNLRQRNPGITKLARRPRDRTNRRQN